MQTSTRCTRAGCEVCGRGTQPARDDASNITITKATVFFSLEHATLSKFRTFGQMVHMSGTTHGASVISVFSFPERSLKRPSISFSF